MLWIAKFQKFAGINCRESKKSQNVTLYDLDLKDAVTEPPPLASLFDNF